MRRRAARCAPAAHAATIYVPGQFPDLGTAYQAAGEGDVIELAAGSHRAQDVPARHQGRDVPRRARREGPRRSTTAPRNVTFDGIEVDAGFAKTAGFENHGADNVTFRDAAIGNVADEKGALVSGSHFTFDNVVFHDAVMTRTARTGVHMECVYAIVVPGFTVRNSTFRDCAIMDLFFTYGDVVDARCRRLRQRHDREQRLRASGARHERRLALLRALRLPDGRTAAARSTAGSCATTRSRPTRAIDAVVGVAARAGSATSARGTAWPA